MNKDDTLPWLAKDLRCMTQECLLCWQHNGFSANEKMMAHAEYGHYQQGLIHR
ncbi:hypothetical protein NIM72_17150 [Pantoea sp. B550]|uniref:hypothetical protein n=1 Tax=Pantoea TaxID=53335 RepID=UPI00137742B5|nr:MULTISPECIES: hypothetical protein [Pantoea]MCP1207238.1 hypothetical protein [Pantoea sp. B550]MCT2416471.1 hypothetical protein [Pantoea sp. XY16]NBB53874.1 hypothetical protein [Pantoea vagans]QZX94819.1 hypothetical protein K6R05_13780 [Pantoea alfalfae]WIL41109.1 hypothetical protein QPJ96_14000 [Pantoea agglomerans]